MKKAFEISKFSMIIFLVLCIGILFWSMSIILTHAQSATNGNSDLVRIEARNKPDCILLDYTFSGFKQNWVDINGCKYAKIKLGKEALMKEVVGAPELPSVRRSIIIPDDAKMAINILKADYYEINDIDIAPSKGFILRNVNPEDVPYTFGKAYYNNSFYPDKLVTMHKPYILRDFRGMVVELNPFQYNPITHTLRVYTSVALEVCKIGEDQINVFDRTYRNYDTTSTFHKIYKRHFLNYAPDIYYNPLVEARYTPMNEIGDMLIIYHDPWLSNIQPLVDHKNAIGINTRAESVSAIGNNVTSIKNYIQNEYNTSNLAFVLLVGDSTQVVTPSASGGESDPTYALVAGNDNYPDIIVGRFSAEAAAQLDTQVLRTIMYEQNIATQQPWFKRGTGIASNQGPGHYGEYDNEHMDLIRTDLLTYGYTIVDQIYDPLGTDLQVTNALNAGRGIINYCGHGISTAWTTTGFDIADINSLVNDNMLPFIFSVACLNGDFGGQTCFAEAWLRATNGTEPTGAIAIYASSVNQSWSPPMDAQDEFNDLLINETYFSFGAMCYAGSCKMIDLNGSGGVDMFKTWHIFGDPSLLVFLKNQPPEANCKNVTVNADGDCQANASIDDGSFDPDPGDTITLTQIPSGPYSLGTTLVTLTVTDNYGTTDACTASVTVLDTTPPSIISPPDITVECSGANGTPVSLGLPNVSDNCDNDPEVTNDSPGLFILGTTIVTWTATDDSGNSSTCTQTVTVEDTTPPTIISISASPNILWQSHHTMVPVTVTCESEDICDEDSVCRIITVTNNQSDDILGDGQTTLYWGEITGDLTVNLRAERTGREDRVYTITVECIDGSGNSSTATTEVTVPHSHGHGYKN